MLKLKTGNSLRKDDDESKPNPLKMFPTRLLFTNLLQLLLLYYATVRFDSYNDVLDYGELIYMKK